jgi:hypothetical protein
LQHNTIHGDTWLSGPQLVQSTSVSTEAEQRLGSTLGPRRRPFLLFGADEHEPTRRVTACAHLAVAFPAHLQRHVHVPPAASSPLAYSTHQPSGTIIDRGAWCHPRETSTRPAIVTLSAQDPSATSRYLSEVPTDITGVDQRGLGPPVGAQVLACRAHPCAPERRDSSVAVRRALVLRSDRKALIESSVDLATCVSVRFVVMRC